MSGRVCTTGGKAGRACEGLQVLFVGNKRMRMSDKTADRQGCVLTPIKTNRKLSLKQRR